MPQLVRMYLQQVAIGFVLSLVFTGALLWLNVANLWHLVTHTSGGTLAVVLLVVFNGIVFSGVQFGIAVMRMADKNGSGGKPRRVVAEPVAVPVRAAAPRQPGANR